MWVGYISLVVIVKVAANTVFASMWRQGMAHQSLDPLVVAGHLPSVPLAVDVHKMVGNVCFDSKLIINFVQPKEVECAMAAKVFLFPGMYFFTVVQFIRIVVVITSVFYNLSR